MADITLLAGRSGTGSVTLNLLSATTGELSAARIELFAGSQGGDIVITDGADARTLEASQVILLQAPRGVITQTGGLLVSDILAAWATTEPTLATQVANYSFAPVVPGANPPIAALIELPVAAIYTGTPGGLVSRPIISLSPPLPEPARSAPVFRLTAPTASFLIPLPEAPRRLAAPFLFVFSPASLAPLAAAHASSSFAVSLLPFSASSVSDFEPYSAANPVSREMPGTVISVKGLFSDSAAVGLLFRGNEADSLIDDEGPFVA